MGKFPQIARTLAAAVALAVTLFVVAANAASPEVLGVRAGRQVDATRIVVDLTQKIDFHVFLLPNPYRVVIDLPTVQWSIDKDGVDRLVRENTLLKTFRFGQFDKSHSRIVMEVSGPVGLKRNFLLNAVGPHPFRLVLDLEPTDDASFVKQSDATRPPVRAEEASVAASGLTRKKRSDVRRVVVIDPGHGGIDPGTIGLDGKYEKVITLAIAKELARQLNGAGRYKAILTRNDDQFMALRDRVAFARAAGADLFISIHADSHSDSETRGASVYTLSDDASDREAAALAAKENKADILSGVDLGHQDRSVTSILIDLAQRETMNRSKLFAGLVVQQFTRNSLALLQRPSRSAGFAVLTAPDVPAVLIEAGYLSNRSDDRLLQTPPYQRRLAMALLRSIDAFFAGEQPDMTASAAVPKN